MSKKRALLAMDFMNEIVHEDGKFAAQGYGDFVKRHDTVNKLNSLIGDFRAKGEEVIFVRFAFTPGYKEQPKNSPVFGLAHEYKAVEEGTWATEFREDVDYQEGDYVVTKPRVSPFYSTNLESYLRLNGITDVYLAGVATGLVVQGAARDAHDRDFSVHIISDCCGDLDDASHQEALTGLARVAEVVELKDVVK